MSNILDDLRAAAKLMNEPARPMPPTPTYWVSRPRYEWLKAHADKRGITVDELASEQIGRAFIRVYDEGCDSEG